MAKLARHASQVRKPVDREPAVLVRPDLFQGLEQSVVHVSAVTHGLRGHDDGAAVDCGGDIDAGCVSGEARHVVDDGDGFVGDGGKHGGCRAAGHFGSFQSDVQYAHNVMKRDDTTYPPFVRTFDFVL